METRPGTQRCPEINTPSCSFLPSEYPLSLITNLNKYRSLRNKALAILRTQLPNNNLIKFQHFHGPELHDHYWTGRSRSMECRNNPVFLIFSANRCDQSLLAPLPTVPEPQRSSQTITRKQQLPSSRLQSWKPHKYFPVPLQNARRCIRSLTGSC